LSNALSDIKDKKLPINLNYANNQFGKNDFMRNLLGDIIHHDFNLFYGFEFTSYMNQVDEWELNRYLLNI
jgi:glutamine synthetase